MMQMIWIMQSRRKQIRPWIGKYRDFNIREITARKYIEYEQTTSLVFITDIIQCGSVKDYIRKRKITSGNVKKWSRQILTALDFLHTQTPIIIHRDIKRDHIFINNTTSKIIIGEFGLSTKNLNASEHNNNNLEANENENENGFGFHNRRSWAKYGSLVCIVFFFFCFLFWFFALFLQRQK